jgi:hypothetical protein
MELTPTTVPANYEDVPQVIRGVFGLHQVPIDQPGVYFLCSGDEVVYVGYSMHPVTRVYSHISDEKDFDRAFYAPCPKERVEEIEAAFLLLLKPKLNRWVGLGRANGPHTIRINYSDVPSILLEVGMVIP